MRACRAAGWKLSDFFYVSRRCLRQGLESVTKGGRARGARAIGQGRAGVSELGMLLGGAGAGAKRVWGSARGRPLR